MTSICRGSYESGRLSYARFLKDRVVNPGLWLRAVGPWDSSSELHEHSLLFARWSEASATAAFQGTRVGAITGRQGPVRFMGTPGTWKTAGDSLVAVQFPFFLLTVRFSSTVGMPGSL